MLRSFIARVRGDLAETLALAQRALDQVPAGKQTLRAGAALNCGWAYARRGESAAAIEALKEASTLAGMAPASIQDVVHHSDGGGFWPVACTTRG